MFSVPIIGSVITRAIAYNIIVNAKRDSLEQDVNILVTTNVPTLIKLKKG
jgi:hypothetical protein